MSTIELDDPYTILGEAERATLQEVSEFIRSGVPDKDLISQRTVYISKNAVLQEQLNSLRTSLSAAYNKRLTAMKQREANLREDAKNEGYRSADERHSMCYGDSKWRDQNETCTILSIISDRCESLEWLLRNLMDAAKS